MLSPWLIRITGVYAFKVFLNHPGKRLPVRSGESFDVQVELSAMNAFRALLELVDKGCRCLEFRRGQCLSSSNSISTVLMLSSLRAFWSKRKGPSKG